MSLRENLITQFNATKKDDQANLLSAYQPTDPAVRQRLMDVARDYSKGDRVRDKAYEEFNNLTLIQVVNRDRKAFNNYTSPASLDPSESWKANTIRPVTRNKVISIAAHITSSLLFPQIFAQNESDEEDKDAAMVIRDLNTWAGEQSGYANVFVKAMVKALVDPTMIMYEGYADVKRKIKKIKPDGTWETTTIRDDVFSGFQNILVPVEELYIGNAYQSDIQKQPFLVWRKVIDYEEAKVKYQDSEDFNTYVRPGVKIFYSENNNGFYQGSDTGISDTQVEEVHYYNRYADLELVLVNGVLISDPNQPIKRDDKKYPFANKGYEYVAGTDFFYFMSLVNKMADDQRVIDTLYNMIIDGTYLQIMPPAVVIGDEEITSSVIIPGAITTLNEESKFQTVNTNNNLNAGLAVMQKVESSISESSNDPLQSGQGTAGTPATAFQISREEANAKTVLGLFGKMVKEFVEEFGNLRVPTILQHMTVAESAQITGDTTRLKFRNFLLQPSEGETGKTRKISFDMDMPETEEGSLDASFELMGKEEKTGMTLIRANPDLIRRNKYMVKVKADFMPEQSEAVKKALNLEAYDRAIQNPFADQELVTKDFLFESYRPGESDKYMKKQSAMQNEQIPGGNSNMTSQILNKATAKSTV